MSQIVHLTSCHGNACIYGSLMMCMVLKVILSNLVTWHFVWFKSSSFIVVGYPIGLLDLKILWGQKSCWFAIVALDLFSATSVCFVNFVLSRYASVWKYRRHRKKNWFPNFQKWQAIFKLLSFLHALSYWNKIRLKQKDFLKLFPYFNNFTYLSSTKVELFTFIGEQRLML